jgi:hypothetical protein
MGEQLCVRVVSAVIIVSEVAGDGRQALQTC